ncbi:MAG: prenyltransferase [Spongiibacteraceae bacterium]|jgi:1,4-dihydroxy-2-naphthoate polyprenyltransferase|nr:prenyltransferase [Spongiibacteraceae bacterium]
MTTTTAVLASARPKFLVLTPLCVMLGYAASVQTDREIDSVLLALLLVAALAAHIAVNALNEYQDFTSGLDLRTVKTPFSGGSGALPNNPAAAKAVLALAALSLATTVLIGLYLVSLRGAPLLALGVIGVITILTYTRWLNRYAFLCLIAPGTAFGLLMVWGTAITLTGKLSLAALWLSLPAFFLVNNLLLLNQFPDLEPDRSVGRNHLAIRYGRKTAARVFTLFLIAAYLCILAAVITGGLASGALLGLTTILLAVPTVNGVLRHADSLDKLQRYLGFNVALTLLTLALLVAGLLFAG